MDDVVKISELLSKAFEESGVTEEEFAMLERDYGQALNDKPCPCGSNIKFVECCKLSWNALVRGRNRTERTVKEEVKQLKRDGKKYRADQPTWMLKVGINPDGDPAVMPIEQGASPFAMAGLLLAAYHALMTEGVIGNIQAGMRTVHQEITGNVPGKRPGIVG